MELIIISAVILVVVYIFRKSIVRWSTVAEKKSTVVVETVNFDVEKDLGQLLDSINSYDGTLADEDDIHRALLAKKSANRGGEA